MPQFVMAALRQPVAEQRFPRGGQAGAAGVTLLYGVMDCEAAAVSLGLHELEHLLEFRNAEANDTRAAGSREAREQELTQQLALLKIEARAAERNTRATPSCRTAPSVTRWRGARRNGR